MDEKGGGCGDAGGDPCAAGCVFLGAGDVAAGIGDRRVFSDPAAVFAVEKPGICSDLCPGTGRPEGGKTRRALSVCLPDDRPGGHHRHGEHRGGGHRADRRRTGCSGVDGADGPDGYGAEICRVSAGGALPAEECPGRAVRRAHVCYASGPGSSGRRHGGGICALCGMCLLRHRRHGAVQLHCRGAAGLLRRAPGRLCSGGDGAGAGGHGWRRAEFGGGLHCPGAGHGRRVSR